MKILLASKMGDPMIDEHKLRELLEFEGHVLMISHEPWEAFNLITIHSDIELALFADRIVGEFGGYKILELMRDEKMGTPPVWILVDASGDKVDHTIESIAVENGATKVTAKQALFEELRKAGILSRQGERRAA